ncbi:hypothetical protein [[Mycoplasma] collis]|uniref:hypothetical protein n=1 Tax=[Mycoplasma] collis TaxID=2127 RepID=UPI00051B23F6|nr:hypothetical protein [[Mycoplasma] collis]
MKKQNSFNLKKFWKKYIIKKITKYDYIFIIFWLVIFLILFFLLTFSFNTLKWHRSAIIISGLSIVKLAFTLVLRGGLFETFGLKNQINKLNKETRNKQVNNLNLNDQFENYYQNKKQKTNLNILIDLLIFLILFIISAPFEF